MVKMDRETEEIIIIASVTLFLGLFSYIGWYLLSSSCAIIRLRRKFKNKAAKGYGKVTKLSTTDITSDNGIKRIFTLTFEFSDGVNKHVIHHIFPSFYSGLTTFNLLEIGQSIPILYFPDNPKQCIPKEAETYPVYNEYKNVCVGIWVIILSAAASFGFLMLFEEYDDSIPIDIGTLYTKLAVVGVVAILYPLICMILRCLFCKNIKKERSCNQEIHQNEPDVCEIKKPVKNELMHDEEIMVDIVVNDEEVVTNGNDIDLEAGGDEDEIVIEVELEIEGDTAINHEGQETVNFDHINMTPIEHDGELETSYHQTIGNSNDEDEFGDDEDFELKV